MGNCVDMFADILRGNTSAIQQIREFAKRDIAIYYLKGQDNKHFHFINTFTEQLYEVPKHSISEKTASKKYYFAGFVRWDDHWEMNGSIFGGWDDASIANNMNEKFQGNFYYYDAGYKNQVDTTIAEQHKAFTAAFGDDFAIAKTAAEFQQNLIKYDEKHYDLVLLNKSVSKEEYLKNNGMSVLLRNHFPKNIPMTMYFNPKIGIEYIDNLHTISSIMKKKFKDLTNDDSRELVGLIVDEGISAQCVKHLMEQVDFKTLYDHYGIKSAKEFEFMLRYYKADDFRVHPPRMNIFNLCKDKWDAIKFDNL
jgi:hypothetical protein